MDIFEQAFTPLRFETLYAYIKSFRTAIKYLEFIGKKIIQDEDDEEWKFEKSISYISYICNYLKLFNILEIILTL